MVWVPIALAIVVILFIVSVIIGYFGDKYLSKKEFIDTKKDDIQVGQVGTDAIYESAPVQQMTLSSNILPQNNQNFANQMIQQNGMGQSSFNNIQNQNMGQTLNVQPVVQNEALRMQQYGINNSFQQNAFNTTNTMQQNLDVQQSTINDTRANYTNTLYANGQMEPVQNTNMNMNTFNNVPTQNISNALDSVQMNNQVINNNAGYIAPTFEQPVFTNQNMASGNVNGYTTPTFNNTAVIGQDDTNGFNNHVVQNSAPFDGNLSNDDNINNIF